MRNIPKRKAHVHIRDFTELRFSNSLTEFWRGELKIRSCIDVNDKKLFQ